MDAELEKWRERPLGEYPYLFLDAYYEQVREDGQVRHLAVLVAVGVTPQGKREYLGRFCVAQRTRSPLAHLPGEFEETRNSVAWNSSPAMTMRDCEQRA